MALMEFVQDGVAKRTSGSFFRGAATNFYPDDNSLTLDDAIEKYLVHGWIPAEKFVTRDTRVVAFGSCFAANISNYLHERQYNILTKKENKAYVTSMGDGIVHTFAIRQQFEWAWLNKQPSQSLWHGYKAERIWATPRMQGAIPLISLIMPICSSLLSGSPKFGTMSRRRRSSGGPCAREKIRRNPAQVQAFYIRRKPGKPACYLPADSASIGPMRGSCLPFHQFRSLRLSET